MSIARGIEVGEYYHVFNRGAHRQNIFKSQSDWIRFLFYTVYFQSPTQFKNSVRVVRSFKSGVGFDISDIEFDNVLSGQMIELVSFCFMTNHFHLILRERVEGGIGRYMQRTGDAYTKYFNTKYEASGHVFQGPYKAVHIIDNRQLLYTSAYIHRNPREIRAWKNKEDRYPWSSYYDYAHENRWGGLLAQEILLDQFEGTPKSNYVDFVKASTAKVFESELQATKLD